MAEEKEETRGRPPKYPTPDGASKAYLQRLKEKGFVSLSAYIHGTTKKMLMEICDCANKPIAEVMHRLLVYAVDHKDLFPDLFPEESSDGEKTGPRDS